MSIYPNSESKVIERVSIGQFYPIEPSYEFLMGFYDGIFYKETKITTNLTYEYLKGFYEGTNMRFK